VSSVLRERVGLTHRQQLLGLGVRFLQREGDTAGTFLRQLLCALLSVAWIPGRITRIACQGVGPNSFADVSSLGKAAGRIEMMHTRSATGFGGHNDVGGEVSGADGFDRNPSRSKSGPAFPDQLVRRAAG